MNNKFTCQLNKIPSFNRDFNFDFLPSNEYLCIFESEESSDMLPICSYLS